MPFRTHTMLSSTFYFDTLLLIAQSSAGDKTIIERNYLSLLDNDEYILQQSVFIQIGK